MIKSNIIQFNGACQEKFKVCGDPLHPTKEMCNDRCKKILEIENSPWGRKANPVEYFIKTGNTKLSANQRKIINLLHREYFSRGKACWLKRRNIIKQAKLSNMDKGDLTRTISRLIKRGILLKIIGISKNQKVPFILPNIYSCEKIDNSISNLDTWTKETDTRGGVRLYCNSI